MPLRDDWASASELVRQLDQKAAGAFTLEILLVDDASLQECNHADFQSHLGAVHAIRILRLRRNLGHQRAIAIGLAHIQKNVSCDAVLVMDADGEDTAEGALRLLHAYSETQGKHAIFAERSARSGSESFAFRCSYQVFRALHRALTGKDVRVGNFSILPPRYLNSLAAMSELWSHYVAAVFRSKLPFTQIPIPRGRRIAGRTKMNFVALIAHGLSAISVFGDVVGVRVLIGSLAGSLLLALAIALVVSLRIFTNRAVPAWLPYALGALTIILLQFIATAASFTFRTLSDRTRPGFVPLRDCSLFTDGEIDVYCRRVQAEALLG